MCQPWNAWPREIRKMPLTPRQPTGIRCSGGLTLRHRGQWHEYVYVCASAKPGERGNGSPPPRRRGRTTTKCIHGVCGYSNLRGMGSGEMWLIEMFRRRRVPSTGNLPVVGITSQFQQLIESL